MASFPFRALLGGCGIPRRATTAACLVVLAGMTGACSRKTTPNMELGGPNPFMTAPDLTTLPGTVFDVKFSPNTMKIEPEKFVHSLRSFSPDHTIYIFDKSSEVARSLQPGKIMFVPGLTLQKVVAIAEDGPDLIVGAEENTPLTEVIEKGTLKWDYPVNFQQIARQRKRAAIPLPGDLRLLAGLDRLKSELSSTAWAAEEEGEGWSFEEVKDWKCTGSAQPDSSGLSFKLHLEREAGDVGIIAKIDVTGHMQNFRNATSMVIDDSSLQDFSFHNSGWNAVANVVWTVSKEKPGTATGEEDIRLPTSFSAPLMIGGIPFSLELSEAVMFKPGFTSGGELAKGAFKLEVNGDNGVKWSGGDASDDSNSSGDGSIEDHGGVAPAAPFAILIAVSAPRIELSTGPKAAFEELHHILPTTLAERLALAAAKLGKTTWGHRIAQAAVETLKAKGAAHLQLITSTSLTIGGAAALIPCQRTQLVLTGNAGVSAQFFKLLKKEYEVNFVRKERVLVLPDIKGCQI